MVAAFFLYCGFRVRQGICSAGLWGNTIYSQLPALALIVAIKALSTTST